MPWTFNDHPTPRQKDAPNYLCMCRVISVAGVTFGVTRLHPAAPSVDKATIWTDELLRQTAL